MALCVADGARNPFQHIEEFYMRKIKTLFVIDRDNNQATDKIVPESSWVLNNEGFATEKFDGSACLFKDGKLWKRYDRKLKKSFFGLFRKGKLAVLELSMFKDAPDGFEACESTPDPKTGHWPGWVPVDAESPDDIWHIEALSHEKELIEGASYELVGPKVQGNKYNLEHHQLWLHGSRKIQLTTGSYDELKQWFAVNHLEGVVWHHPDGRMVKLRKKDFGLPW